MAAKQGRRRPGTGGRRPAGGLPVLRWLQVGAVAAGLGAALVTTPDLAQADTGTDGPASSRAVGPSDGSDDSPGADSRGVAADDADSAGDSSSGAGQDATNAEGEDGPGAPEGDSEDDDVNSPGADVVSDRGSPGRPTERTSVWPDTDTLNEDGPSTDNDGAALDGPAKVWGYGYRRADSTSQIQDSSQILGSSEDSSTGEDASTVSAPSEVPSPDSTEAEAITGGTATTRAAAITVVEPTANAPTAMAHSTGQSGYPDGVSAPVTWRSILTEGLSWLGLGALAPHLPVPQMPVPDLIAGLWVSMRRPGVAAPADTSTATVSTPSVTIHNNSGETIWVYNLPASGDYAIPADFQPVEIPSADSAPVTLAVGTGKPGDPQNRIYIVEGDAGFALPVASSGGVDPFNPTAVTVGNSFHNYSFVEYFLYPANGGYEYTVDTSYIDEWSLPIQSKFTIPTDVPWSGAVSGTTYGFNDFDTVVSQLKAAGAHLPDGGSYQDLVWSGTTPWSPYPPDTVSRIIGPDKVWAQQSQQPASNINMNNAGWVPTSYQDFVQYGAHPQPTPTVFPYAYNGNEYSTTQDNFDFWRYQVTAPAGTPYPIALRTSAKLDGFPGADGVWGFFAYPNDETAGQFTNIPTSVSLDLYVHGSGDGVSDSVIEGGRWLYSSSPTRSDADLLKPGRNMLVGTDSTDTFILDYIYKSRRGTPLVIAQWQDHDIVAIDKTSLPGAISNNVDIVDCFWPGGIFANYDSQFIYDRSTGLLYYDRHPHLFGYTGVLANLSLSQIDPSHAVFVL